MHKSATAIVSAIKRLTIHDGPGTRTTVFLKGCPLRCVWCHNPELISAEPQLLFHEKRCKFCGECQLICPNQVHSFIDRKHRISRDGCTVCCKCTESCLSEALTICGVKRTAEEVFASVITDKMFYQNSGGGLTVSGGEPLLYPEFVCELFRLSKRQGISTALDTCGHIPYDAFEQVLSVTDLILYDLKGMDAVQHQANTGLKNGLILENLQKLSKTSTPLEIRMPIIPGLTNDESEIQEAGIFLRTISNLVRIKLLSYNSMAHGKYQAAGLPDTLPDKETPTLIEMKKLRNLLLQYLCVEICVA